MCGPSAAANTQRPTDAGSTKSNPHGQDGAHSPRPSTPNPAKAGKKPKHKNARATHNSLTKYADGSIGIPAKLAKSVDLIHNHRLGGSTHLNVTAVEYSAPYRLSPDQQNTLYQQLSKMNTADTTRTLASFVRHGRQGISLALVIISHAPSTIVYFSFVLAIIACVIGVLLCTLAGMAGLLFLGAACVSSTFASLLGMP